MKQTSWPDVAPINQKNYYTYGPVDVRARLGRGLTGAWQ
jgi:hypothetical protein